MSTSSFHGPSTWCHRWCYSILKGSEAKSRLPKWVVKITPPGIGPQVLFRPCFHLPIGLACHGVTRFFDRPRTMALRVPPALQGLPGHRPAAVLRGHRPGTWSLQGAKGRGGFFPRKSLRQKCRPHQKNKKAGGAGGGHLPKNGETLKHGEHFGSTRG